MPVVANAPAPPTFVAVTPQPDWTAAWWQWTVAFNSQQVVERGAVDCALGQNGDVWFLAGTPGTPGYGVVERSCTVPAGKTLVAPLYTTLFYNGPGENYSVPQKYQLIEDYYSDQVPGQLNTQACEMTSSIDGTSVVHERVKSPPFGVPGDPEAVQDGFWLAFRPEPGVYELHFSGKVCQFGNPSVLAGWVDVTYTLTVQ